MKEAALATVPRGRSIFSAVFACFAASTLVAIVLSRRTSLGMGDLPAFVLWTVPFAGFVALAQGLLAARARVLPGWSVWLGLLALGPLVAVLWTLLVSVALGPWFQAFTIPVLFCWVAGAIAGGSVGLATAGALRPHEGGGGSLAGLVLGMLLGMNSEALVSRALDDQRLQVVVLTSIEPSAPLSVDAVGEQEIGADGVEQLRVAGITGRLRFSYAGVHGRGPKSARAILVLQGALQQAVDLRQPDASRVVYCERAGRWQLFPAEAPTLNRSIALHPATDKRPAMYDVQMADGSLQGGGL